jgi:hypothetical protein
MFVYIEIFVDWYELFQYSLALYIFFFLAQQPLVDQGLLIVEASEWH